MTSRVAELCFSSVFFITGEPLSDLVYLQKYPNPTSSWVKTRSTHLNIQKANSPESNITDLRHLQKF